jgi:type IV pilus assembly protein PilC
MKTHASDVADFYQQLALLVRSNLALPESLRQLGEYFPKREFQEAIRQIGEMTERGEKFSEAIKRYPQFFHPFHAQLISAGEESGTLPEVLFAVARFARFGQLMTTRVRDILAYPLLTIHVCVAVLLFMSVYVIPGFVEIFEDLLEGARLPYITQLVVSIGAFINAGAPVVVPLYAVFFVFTLWLFTPFVLAHRAMLHVVGLLPGSCRVGHSLDSARLCTMLSTFLRQKMTITSALATASQLVERAGMQKALMRVSEAVKSGDILADAFSREPAIDRLIALTFRHTPEAELSSELMRLGELFEHRVTLAARSATITWTIIAMIMMIFGVGFVIIAMFVPMITIVSHMGA